jgi:hypothetical protein
MAVAARALVKRAGRKVAAVAVSGEVPKKIASHATHLTYGHVLKKTRASLCGPGKQPTPTWHGRQMQPFAAPAARRGHWWAGACVLKSCKVDVVARSSNDG